MSSFSASVSWPHFRFICRAKSEWDEETRHPLCFISAVRLCRFALGSSMVPPNRGLVWAHTDHEVSVRRLEVLRILSRVSQTLGVQGSSGAFDTEANSRSQLL